MKNILIALALLLTVSSCFLKKKDAVEPDLTGTYNITSYLINNREYVTAGVSGNIVVSRPSTSTISFTLTQSVNGSSSSASATNITITKATSGYTFSEGTDSGSIDGSTFVYRGSGVISGVQSTYSITAKK